MLTTILAVALLSIKVTPAFCNAPCNMSVVLTVERDEFNKEVLLEVASEDFYRSSTLDTTYDPTTKSGTPRKVQVFYERLPAGQTEVTATLYGRDGKVRQKISYTLRVIGFQS